MTYRLHLTEDDIATIAFVGNRYCWSDVLSSCEAGENLITEQEAWNFKEKVDADMEGGHDAFPMLDPRSDLCAKLAALYYRIV